MPCLSRCTVLLGMAIALGACTSFPGPGELDRARRLGDEYKWHEAMAAIKGYVQGHPDAADGHLLLGRAHLRIPLPSLGVARGELQLALDLFRESGDRGIYTPLMTPEVFEAYLHHELAAVALRRLDLALKGEMPDSWIQQDVSTALGQIRKGLALEPDNESLQQQLDMLAPYEKKPPEHPLPAPDGPAVAL